MCATYIEKTKTHKKEEKISKIVSIKVLSCIAVRIIRIQRTFACGKEQFLIDVARSASACGQKQPLQL